MGVTSAVPSGLAQHRNRIPNAEALGYCQDVPPGQSQGLAYPQRYNHLASKQVPSRSPRIMIAFLSRTHSLYRGGSLGQRRGPARDSRRPAVVQPAWSQNSWGQGRKVRIAPILLPHYFHHDRLFFRCDLRSCGLSRRRCGRRAIARQAERWISGSLREAGAHARGPGSPRQARDA